VRRRNELLKLDLRPRRLEGGAQEPRHLLERLAPVRARDEDPIEDGVEAQRLLPETGSLVLGSAD
jgi:hypothetical protein